MVLGIPSLETKILFESNPLKSRILVWRSAVSCAQSGVSPAAQDARSVKIKKNGTQVCSLF